MGGNGTYYVIKDYALKNIEELRKTMTDTQILEKLWEVMDPLVFNEGLMEIKNLKENDGELYIV